MEPSKDLQQYGYVMKAFPFLSSSSIKGYATILAYAMLAEHIDPSTACMALGLFTTAFQVKYPFREIEFTGDNLSSMQDVSVETIKAVWQQRQKASQEYGFEMYMNLCQWPKLLLSTLPKAVYNEARVFGDVPIVTNNPHRYSYVMNVLQDDLPMSKDSVVDHINAAFKVDKNDEVEVYVP